MHGGTAFPRGYGHAGSMMAMTSNPDLLQAKEANTRRVPHMPRLTLTPEWAVVWWNHHTASASEPPHEHQNPAPTIPAELSTTALTDLFTQLGALADKAHAVAQEYGRTVEIDTTTGYVASDAPGWADVMHWYAISTDLISAQSSIGKALSDMDAQRPV